MSEIGTIPLHKNAAINRSLAKLANTAEGQVGRPRKRPKIDRDQPGGFIPDKTPEFPRNTHTPSVTPKRYGLDTPNEHIDLETTEVKNGESIAVLRRMVLGKIEYTTVQTVPGKYLALDCEMVGVGIDGDESSLARVSVVNYAGAIVLDVFVRQRERVVDYRTQWSGVRSTDLAGSAKPFKEVQQMVADLIKDRILVGHAVHNDLKALLLPHPSPQIRDTQSLAHKHHVVKSRRPALRVLAKQELDIVIQSGEHSSVTDARATMALFRLYKKQWETGIRSHAPYAPSKNKINDTPLSGKAINFTQSLPPSRKRKHPESDLSDVGAESVDDLSSPSLHPAETSSTTKLCSSTRKSQPSGNSLKRKGVSSGISTVTRRAGGMKEVKRKGNRIISDNEKGTIVGNSSRGEKRGSVGEKWWKSLGGGKKGSIKV